MVLLSVYAARPEFATKGGVTRINVNALFMLSFPAVDLTYNTNIWHQINLIGGTEPTCFYTGDSNLKGNQG